VPVESAGLLAARLVWNLRALLLLTIVVELATGHLLFAMEALLALGLCLLLRLLPGTEDVPFVTQFEIVCLLMALGNCTLGVFLNYYRTIPYYDKLLHLVNPLAIALLGVLSLSAIARAHRIAAPPTAIALLVVLATLGLAAVWEILEFSSDLIFSQGTQGSPNMDPLQDTMWDLVISFLGAIIGAFGCVAYFALRRDDTLRAEAGSRDFNISPHPGA
jgi:uncharacterized membrane protein YjdF